MRKKASPTLQQKDLFADLMADTPKLPEFALTLEVQNMGHVPSFKNSKMILGIRPVPGQPKMWQGVPFVATKTDLKKRMEQITQSFLSQLLSITQTTSGGTQTGRYPPSLIASLLPDDDTWEWLRDLRIKCEKVEKGEEGATIVLFRI